MGQVTTYGLAAGTASIRSLDRRRASDEPGRVQKELIAIVDDDEYARLGLRALIEALGRRAAEFVTAEEYLASNVRESAACLILDVHLPGMSGPDLQAHLVAEAHCPPTVFVTGRFEEDVRKRVIAAGALGYLIKPCSDAALLNCLGKVLRNGGLRTVLVGGCPQKIG
jgi:FixJ family two-component response regulator